ncbi:mercury(II) reductase [Geobacter sulfurreducens]|uniref:Mercuric reductase n=1 Tax=Geobacter sulfurreducens (strain ATCC 51573 / DSM 12127 / PCA) TaxID=243231 RepID=Q746U4_GEOSL|nr:mercury(II) reductase [Geobacter sulfurreducens]AAR36814.1 dihydrolipoamide dehydrogenase [Geobacter sulfurreducens PCA]AJY69675.1 dihydrolipoamide dehydrogenase [Geobacter sulfurreducens]UAC04070.1 mercury(II) reductase [Geobacter sulfurreducens]HBB70093.1 mercury(II) reductase [Geobacter sulfurreducens]HCD97132.1 mercury(II) reductase [Geobacter sulfurreducens]
MSDKHDLIILGSGSTAFAAALRAHSRGARVLMVEKSVLGGTCINWGCVPSKTLIHGALFYQEGRLGARLGLGECGNAVDLAPLMTRKEEVVKHLRTTRYLDILRNTPGLELAKGTGRFLGSGRLEVVDQVYRCDRYLVAVGGTPRIPKIPGLESTPFLTSRGALLLKRFPASLIIIGGGVIAVELGQMFQRLGTRVTILEHGPRILAPIEPEPALAIRNVLRDEGMEIICHSPVCAVSGDGSAVSVEVEREDGRRTYTAEKLLLAVGTTPATRGIGLELAGVETDGRGFVTVDERMRTTAPGIWAAGDCTGGMMIATVGAREGIIAVDDMFATGCGCAMDHLSVPMAIFTDPEVGAVGYTEQGARDAGLDPIVSILPVSAIPKAHVTGHTAGVIKLVAERATGRLLGAHLACHRGAELINEAALAIRLKATFEDLANALHVYPSIGEGLRLCAQGFTRDVSKLSCCAE